MTKNFNVEYLRCLIKEKDEEIKKLKKENAELIKLISFNLEKLEFVNKDREIEIINFIKNNPGTTKIALLKKLANEYNENNDKIYGTSSTLNKSINWLVKQNIIRLEKEHKQKHSLYLNDKNILLKNNMDLIDLKDRFFYLMDFIVKTKNDTIEFENYILIHIMIDLYLHVINSYVSKILLKWSNEFKNDDTTINKINFMVFFTLFQINLQFNKQFDFSNIISDKTYSFKDLSSPILLKVIDDSFLLKPKMLVEYIQHFKRMNLHKEFLSLIDSIWQISLPLFRFLYNFDIWNIYPIAGKELIVKHFSLLMLFCLNEKDKYLGYNEFKRKKDNLFDLSFTSEQQKKEMKDIVIEYIKSNSELTKEYTKLKEDYKMLE